MEDMATSTTNAGHQCTCNICSLHPHLKEALESMKPPKMRLYSRAELLELLEKDVSNISDEKHKQVAGSEESWWHLCSADPTFPFYVIPTKEFVAALAAYLACRVKSIQREARKAAGNCRCCSAASVPAARSSSSSSCCSRWDPNRPITLLECGAGTGILAAHLLPLLQQQLQPLQRDGSTTLFRMQEQQQHLDARSSEPNEQVDPPVDLQDYAAVCSEAHNENRSADVPTTSASSRKPPGSDSTAVSAFSYVASEPRRELQWCPAALAATREGCRSAMERYFPQLVICCWMPFNVDWTEKARSSCCACCRCMHRESSPSAGLRQSHHSHCQVHEYILIGHAEGGLVGRPFETWGMRCSEAGLLPLGVDYEVPQAVSRALQLSAPCVSSDEESNDHDFDKEPLKSPTIEKQAGRKRRRGSAEDHRGTNGRQWQSANNFHSIPPDVPAAGEVDDHTTLGNDVESTDSVASTQHELDGEFGGVGMRQQLLPLRDRPYYREGFTRLPPLPKDAEAAMSEETTESGVLLRELQQALPLSRFDSPHSLRANLPSVSKVVVFRRVRN